MSILIDHNELESFRCIDCYTMYSIWLSPENETETIELLFCPVCGGDVLEKKVGEWDDMEDNTDEEDMDLDEIIRSREDIDDD
jgi:NAD-dependent SIR2 family protein deacetylase